MLNLCKYFLLFFLSFCIFASGSSFAEVKKKSKVVKIVGTSHIVEDDTSSAKDKAISNGLISAVESVLNETIPQNVMVANFKTISDILYKYTNRFVQGYKVLAETKHKDDYRVLIQATVSTKKILRHLNKAGIVLNRANKHKVLFLISENNLQDIESQFWWGQGMAYIKTVSDIAITQEMKKRGFGVLSHRLVNRATVTKELNTEPFIKELSVDDIIALGVYFNADIVVSGSAKAEQAQNTMGEDRTFTGSMNLDIFRTDSGEKIDSISVSTTAVNTDESIGGNNALIEVAIIAANDISSKINIAMKKTADKSTMIEVIVEGTDFFKNYSKLIKRIKTLPEIKKITQREKRPNRAIVVIEHMGNGKNFAKKIMGETFENFGLNISEVTRNHVRLEMVPLGSSLFDR